MTSAHFPDPSNITRYDLTAATTRYNTANGYVPNRIMRVYYPTAVPDSRWRLNDLYIETNDQGFRDTYFRILRIAPRFGSPGNDYDAPRVLGSSNRLIMVADKKYQQFPTASESVTWSQDDFIGVHFEQVGHAFPGMRMIASIERYDIVSGKSYELLEDEARVLDSQPLDARYQDVVAEISKKWFMHEPYMYGDDAHKVERDILKAISQAVDAVTDTSADEVTEYIEKSLEAVREKAVREQSLEIVGGVVAVLRDYLPNDYGIKIETRTKD